MKLKTKKNKGTEEHIHRNRTKETPTGLYNQTRKKHKI